MLKSKKPLINKVSSSKGREVLSETKNWYADRHQWVVVQRNFFALITLAAMVLALSLSYNNYRMAPLKTVKPFIIQIDEKTGATKVVNSLKSKDISSNDIIRKYFVAQYVRARETYDAATFQDNYQKVRLMSDNAVFRFYQEYNSSQNPRSPVNYYGDQTKRNIRIKSITFLNDNTAQVRVLAETLGRYETEQHLIILITFDFSDKDLTLQDRYINPLGFTVENYRVEEEVLTQ